MGLQELQKRRPEAFREKTFRCKLVQVDHQPNVDAVKVALPCGKDTPGQLMGAFLAKFPQPNGNEIIGVADDSWVKPGGHRFFPCLYGGGECWMTDFHWDVHFHGNFVWWLVVVDDEEPAAS